MPQLVFPWQAILAAILMFLMASSSVAQSENAILRLKAGPHLFIDDYLIAETSFLIRTVNNPVKLDNPIITGGKSGHENFQPYLTVLRDPETRRFRMWYNTPVSMTQSHIGYIESADGVNWIPPHRVLRDPGPIDFGASVVDRGRDFPNRSERYVLGYYSKDGLTVATSTNGLDWKLLSPTSVLKHNHDIISLRWDPLRQRFLATVSVVERGSWQEPRRIPYESVSSDLILWKQPWRIITPEIGAPIERGETQFYCMGGIIVRGELMIGLVKVLRDDLNATPGKSAVEMGDTNRKAAGLGYTVLAWSRDGVSWQRDHQQFILNNPVAGSWDHAMAWGDEQIIVGGETFVYYAGYARGHKVARFEERQIGLARMPRDRYVSRDAGPNTGRLLTKNLVLNGARLTVNANVVGSLRVRLLDLNGKTKSNFDWVSVQGDSTSHVLPWKAPLDREPVRIEFESREAQLFGFDLLQ